MLRAVWSDSLPLLRAVSSCLFCAPRQVNAELEALKAQLEAARQENLKLKVAGGGAVSASEEEAALSKYLELLKQVVAMRRKGAFDAKLFDAYNGAMVGLRLEQWPTP